MNKKNVYQNCNRIVNEITEELKANLKRFVNSQQLDEFGKDAEDTDEQIAEILVSIALKGLVENFNKEKIFNGEQVLDAAANQVVVNGK